MAEKYLEESLELPWVPLVLVMMIMVNKVRQWGHFRGPHPLPLPIMSHMA
jgi:hypothetical protein